MRVSARVDTSSVARSLAFRLPDVPAKVELTTDADNVSGEVVGRGDEAIATEPLAGRRTKFSVESGGGTFTLRWGRLGEAATSWSTWDPSCTTPAKRPGGNRTRTCEIAKL